MKNLILLLTLSLFMDITFIKTSLWNIKQKVEFILKKYWHLILFFSKIKRFQLGKSFTILQKNKIFFASSSGLTPYQSILVNYSRLLKLINLKKTATVVDVGANVGFFSLFIKNILPQAKIYAFEPIPLIFDTLQINLNKYRNIFLFNKAVFDIDGKSTIMLYEDDPQHSMLIKNKKNASKYNSIQVKTIKLDSFIKQQNIHYVDLLKIDVETFEKQVLKGGVNALSKTKYLLIEISVVNNNNYTFSELVSILYSNKYNFQLLSFHTYDIASNQKFMLGDFLFENTALK